MKFWVGVTDNSWFNFLAQLSPDEVNFWQPSGRHAFRALKPGELFLFKLHSPYNFITGGGVFVRHSIMPLSLAWEAFEKKNGTDDFHSFRSRIMNFRRDSVPDPMIGCIILAEPFFFPRASWIAAPVDWQPNIVQGRTYDTNDPIAESLWSQVQQILAKSGWHNRNIERDAVNEDTPRYGAGLIVHPRLGQGAFRILVTEAYGKRCAVTGERTLPVLEAAHIKPYAESGPHQVNNGLLLRSDLHKLFDLGYMTITPDYYIEVSRRIKKEYENGREYYAMHGKELRSLPESSLEQPLRNYIEWHNNNIYTP